MKKHIFRVKQLADQTFNRAEKTNALSDDLQDADRKTEFIKTTCQNMSKRISACLPLASGAGEANGPLKDRKEKALKKSPEHALAQAMRDCVSSFDDIARDTPLRMCLEQCAHTEEVIVEDNIDRDHLIDSDVVAQLQSLLENEIPSIVKHKRNVTKMCLDMDSAKQRFGQANKHSNTPAGTAKVESVKEELDECEAKLEQSRDALACEMFQFIVRESDICHYLLKFYKYRRTYFQHALGQLDHLIPHLEQVAGDSSVRKMYGTRLEDHLRVTGRQIAYPIELCCYALNEIGLDEEGLFRIAGGGAKMKRMKASMDANCLDIEKALEGYRDPHVIAGCLKSYLRELPEPLLTFKLYEEWLDAVKTQGSDPEMRLKLLKEVLAKLPTPQHDNLRYLINFFRLLSDNNKVNKMTPQNLAIVLAPNLIWLGEDNVSGICLTALNATALYARIVELLVSNCDYFFPGDFKIDPTMNASRSDGIDNKGFDPRLLETKLKRSQSVNSLPDEPEASPRPRERQKKNKPAAPTPPIPTSGEKPARPAPPTATTTLPRKRSQLPKETKATNTDDLMSHSVDCPAALFRAQGLRNDTQVELRHKATMESETTHESTVTKESLNAAEFCREPDVDTAALSETVKPEHESTNKAAKAAWFLGNDKPMVAERPVIPQRPASIKPQLPAKNLRNAIGVNDSTKYENISLSSNENLTDEPKLQRAQCYLIEKQQAERILVSDKKRDRSRDKVGRLTEKNGEVVSSNDDVSKDKDETGSDRVESEHRNVEPRLRKSSLSETKRPSSLSVSGGAINEKPIRPPKPEHFTSPSHCRTFSDGQIIEKTMTHKRDVLPESHSIEKPVPQKRSCNINEAANKSSENSKVSSDRLRRCSGEGDCNAVEYKVFQGANEHTTFSREEDHKCNNDVFSERGVNIIDNQVNESVEVSREGKRVSTEGKRVSSEVSHEGLRISCDSAKVIKHPSTSPPPPPAAAKPRGPSQGDSTDF